MSAVTVGLSISQGTSALSGAGLLGLVTTGMYNDPLSMYREYIQNSADAVAGSSLSSVRVDIAIDVNQRRIRIRDNGPGLSREKALDRLIPIGRSDKRLGTDRGFRGVGRLAGLAFAKAVCFTTRANADQTVIRITWHSDRLPELTSTKSELEQAIVDCVDIEVLPDSTFPEHFFDVEIMEVARHSAGLLLNRDAVRNYVGEICPVPISRTFPFADRVRALFDGIEAPLALEVTLDGDSYPVERPYRESIRLSADRETEYSDFEPLRIPSVDDKCDAAVGWVAHSVYLGAIPREQRVRGIRARVGNIQIGDEAIFDDLFVEERFNRWCVGEIHILDSRIVPNARRDYFEPGPHVRNLENQLSPVLRSISSRCRRESTIRNRERRVLSSLSDIEDLYALATSGFLAAEDCAGLIRRALQEVADVRKSIARVDSDGGIAERLCHYETSLADMSAETQLQRFDDMAPSEVLLYQRIFGALASLAPSPGAARELIERVFAEASGTEPLNRRTTQGQVSDSESQSRLAMDAKGAVTSR